MYMDYELNKGIGESAEFKGLKAQYLFIFAGGLLALFVLFVILYMAGIGQWLCIAFGVTSASALVWLTFHLNGKFGEHGLMKLLAKKQGCAHPEEKRRIGHSCFFDIDERCIPIGIELYIASVLRFLQHGNSDVAGIV